VPLVAVDLHQVDLHPLMGMDASQPAAETKALDGGLEERAADRVQHHVGAATIGELEHGLAEIT
jgi:hypothetical protein